jgi:hypothetical protein
VRSAVKLSFALGLAALCLWLFWPRAVPSKPVIERRPNDLIARPSGDSVALKDLDTPAESIADAPAPTEATRVEMQAQAEAGQCRIIGLLVRRVEGLETAIPNASVTLAEDSNPGDFMPRRGLMEPFRPVLGRSRTGQDGSFEFTGIAPNQYRVRTILENGDTSEALVQVSKHNPIGRTELIAGTARIHGTLRGIDGAPIECARVQLESRTPGLSMQGFTWRATDAQGCFSFGSLAAGPYMLLVVAPNENSPVSRWPGRRHLVQLIEGDDIALDAGISTGCPHWRGHLRYNSGHPLPGKISLALEQGEWSARGSQVSTTLYFELDGQARFDLCLDPADWTPKVSWRGGSWTARDPIHVGTEGLVQDLVLPGVRLEGRILDAATHAVMQGVDGKLSVRLASSGAAGERKSSADDQGAFAFEMLEEGDWEATTWPLDLATPTKRVKFHIAATETVHTLDLEVRKP